MINVIENKFLHQGVTQLYPNFLVFLFKISLRVNLNKELIFETIATKQGFDRIFFILIVNMSTAYNKSEVYI